MTIGILVSIIIFLCLLLATVSYYLWKFAKIIMVFEDDLSEAITSLSNVNDSIQSILEMQMYFDSPEVRKAVEDLFDELKLCRAAVNNLIDKFTARSKSQYVTFWDEEPVPEHEQEYNFAPKLPGQPPGTPNPLELIRRSERMTLDVRRQK